MKPIGPYVAARELPGSASASLPASPVRTLRATDRLTGMPVLLHVLPYALNLPTLPEHPHLLPITDSGMDGENAYVVTELPPYAQPASDPRLSAPGALSALSALHAQGLTHGGITPAQLWQFGGTVALAGAGLPWRQTPATPADDLHDLAHTLQALRVLPTALRPLLDSPAPWTAEQALARLHGQAGAATSPADSPAIQTPPATTAPVQTAPAVQAPSAPRVVTAAPTPSASSARTQVSEKTAPRPQTPAPQAPATEVRPKANSAAGTSASAGTAAPAAGANQASVTPAATDWLTEAEVPAGPGSAAPTPTPDQPATDASIPNTNASGQDSQTITTVAVPAPVSAPGSADQDRGDAGATPTEPAPSTRPPPRPVVSPFSGAPAGQVETPQERRKRQNEERRAQAMLDSQAAAQRKAQRLQAEQEQAGQEVSGETGADTVPPPIQFGFPEGDAPSAPRLSMREVDRLPASLRRPKEEAPAGQPSRLPASGAGGHRPARRVDPIRIGWDEDDSWRVIRTPTAPPPPASPTLPRWLLPVLAAVVILFGLVWAWGALRPASPGTGAASSAACCTVPVTLRGAAGVTATLTVEKAPRGASLEPGQSLGKAPGKLNFPVEGTYQLRVMAQGYTPASLTVVVPRTQPVTINLGN
ncbi:PEGA domain-containing protein [Deinococcus aerophilus]|uniref:PEGA domain-containing protein n=1 Tax=Deinococcus aerophilus TaxID=522488 RepID=A0ABQ2GKD9_9DEIO|nr:PEGA domain-containing protein [Deinococcus aerophilus]GGM00799.1 hypothetical protein GCM10010841_06700 [Deinococcus aerophilus]